ncbi:hypothetical protein ACFFLS_01595 [Flavobacterium procerum]|uniref:Lipoprotein n=1 Tax=Flavobacterium procerum TaxID=1455569 RepID=A0ABV6BNU4_9FLAO
MALIFISALFFQGCPSETDETPDRTFFIVNNSTETISVFYIFSESELMPNRFDVKPTLQIMPEIEYEEFLKYDDFDKNRKLRILIYKQSTLENYTWNEIRKLGMYDMKYDFTLEEMKSINYKINYDGNSKALKPINEVTYYK